MLGLRLLLALVPVSMYYCQDLTLTEEERAIFQARGVIIELKDDFTWTFKHSGLPTHETGPYGDNPNEATEQNHEFDIPRYANVVETKGCLRLGEIGMAINGIPFYNPYSGDGRNAVEGQCQEIFDECSGHPQREGVYHYHKLPNCVYNGTQNELLGVALDGYPIYGPLSEDGTNLTSADLDDCHGHVHQGRYKYRITFDFPYILGCFNGSTNQTLPGGDGSGRPPPRGKRSVNEHREYDQTDAGMFAKILKKRQTNDCTATASDWMMKTCYAFCENPGDGSYHNCDPPSLNGTSTTTQATSDRTESHTSGVTGSTPSGTSGSTGNSTAPDSLENTTTDVSRASQGFKSSFFLFVVFAFVTFFIFY